MDSLFNELSKIASKRAKKINTQPICVCNKDSWHEICIRSDVSGSVFFVCPACDPQRECELCNRTGHRFFLETHKEKQNDGTEIEITIQNAQPHACVCMNVHKIASFLNKAEIPDRYIKANFVSFHLEHLGSHQRKILEQNIEKMKTFCENIENKYFATLFGPVGSGKTLLATATLKYLIAKQKCDGKFIDFQYLLSVIRKQFEQNQTGETLIDTYRKAEILVIDEFAKGRLDKEWPLEKLDDLINYRYNHKKVTILTTNYLPFQLKYDQKEKPSVYATSAYSADTPIHESFWDKSLLERIGERMYDRLIEVSEFINFTSLPSYRKHMAKDLLNQLRGC